MLYRAENILKQPVAPLLASQTLQLRSSGRGTRPEPCFSASKPEETEGVEVNEALASNFRTIEFQLKTLLSMDQDSWSNVRNAALHSMSILTSVQNHTKEGAQIFIGRSHNDRYSQRLPRIADKVINVLGGKFEALNDSVNHYCEHSVDEEILVTREGSSGLQAHLRRDCILSLTVEVEGLVTSAIQRAEELKSDQAVGNRHRKKKALTDLIRSLGELGMSKHLKAVPPGN